MFFFLSLLLHLLIACKTKLCQSQNCNQYKEHNRFCLSHASAVCTCIKCLEDVECQHFCSIDHRTIRLYSNRHTFCQSQVLVEQLEGLSETGNLNINVGLVISGDYVPVLNYDQLEEDEFKLKDIKTAGNQLKKTL